MPNNIVFEGNKELLKSNESKKIKSFENFEKTKSTHHKNLICNTENEKPDSRMLKSKSS
jgi:hypothetical protein